MKVSLVINDTNGFYSSEIIDACKKLGYECSLIKIDPNTNYKDLASEFLSFAEHRNVLFLMSRKEYPLV